MNFQVNIALALSAGEYRLGTVGRRISHFRFSCSVLKNLKSLVFFKLKVKHLVVDSVSSYLCFDLARF